MFYTAWANNFYENSYCSKSISSPQLHMKYFNILLVKSHAIRNCNKCETISVSRKIMNWNITIIYQETYLKNPVNCFQVITTLGPRKPQRSSSISESTINYYTPPSNTNFLLETSFASLQSPSSNSSINNGFYSTRSQPSPISFRQQVHSSFTNTVCSKTSSASMSTPAPHHSMPSTSLTKSFSLSLRSCTSPKFDLNNDDWLGLAPLASPESMSELSSISSRASLVTTTNVVVELNATPKVSL